MNARTSRFGLPSILLLALGAASLASVAHADEVFAKPPTPGGGLNASSWTYPDGSDSDQYAWDEFTLTETQTITEVRWRGGYALNGQYGKANDFRISFFESIAGGFQPVITALPEHESQEVVIATFHTNNNAGESPAGSSGGFAMYDYHFTLPTPVTLQGGVKYWFRVVAGQPGYPDWGMATGTGGNGSHFKFLTGASMFQNWPHDLAFSMHARWANLGGGHAGVTGVPVLACSGVLSAGSTVTASVSGAAPSSPCWIVVGGSAINLPFAGGTLVPDPLLVYAFATDGNGALNHNFHLKPTLPAGIHVVMQTWIYDTGASELLAATNAVSSTN